MIVHPEYKENTLQNDIAILLLKDEATETDFVRAIALPESRALYETGTPITIIGWGGSESGFPDILQKHVYEVSDQEACKQFWQSQDYPLLEGMMCTGKPPLDGHAGYSPGPLQRWRRGAHRGD